MPVTDTYIEKDAQINEEIDRLRHASTQALLTRKDVIIVASVSCIYGLGSPKEYEKVHLKISINDETTRDKLLRKLISIYFDRTNADLTPGKFRALGNRVEVMPVNEKIIYSIQFEDGKISKITIINAMTREIISNESSVFIFPAKHYITPEAERARALLQIESELKDQLAHFQKEGKVLEADRIKRRTQYDMALIREIGYCNGIENYSRHFDGREEGEPPYTLLSYFPHKKDGTPDFLTIIDESHVTIPQIAGMQAGDASRKKSLVDYGFRLPSAIDNRPLNFKEFEERIGQVIFTSATPSKYEREHSKQIVEQIIRPTGLIDPEINIRPVVESGSYKGQIKDFIAETEATIKKGGRVLATTLTKKMAEDLSEYLKERNIKTTYLHSDIETLDRITILTDFRKGKYNCLVGVNLLREGLDLPEVELIGILDADKEGFLRSEVSLIQTIGRAARNVNGKVILYADSETNSITNAVRETYRRREIQIAYNKKHGITPKTIIKKIQDITEAMRNEQQQAVANLLAVDMEMISSNKDKQKLIKSKKTQMQEAIKNLDFETAAILRDEIYKLDELNIKSKNNLSTSKKAKKNSRR
jgi:excinuclease ABC subunit B